MLVAAKPSSCIGCPLYSQPGPVPGQGPVNPRFVYIAQNPAVVECETWIPLSGPTGSIFNRQLYEAGVARNSIYITNQVKCLTPGNRKPTSLEVAKCKPILEAELEKLKYNTVVLAGDTAMQAHLDNYSTWDGKYDIKGTSFYPDKYEPGVHKFKKSKGWVKTDKRAGIIERMGTVEVKNNIRYIPTIHPSSIMRDPEHKLDAVEHLKKARLLGPAPTPEYLINLWPTDKEVIDAVDYVKHKGKAFADDVETYSTLPEGEEDYVGTDTEVSMCAFAYGPHQGMVLTPQQIHLLYPLYTDAGVWWFEHNGNYDAFFIARYVNDNVWKAKRFDTLLAAHYLRSNALSRLKPNVISRYTFLPYYNRDLERCNRRLYCCLDGIGTLDTGYAQMGALRSEKIWDLFFRYGMPILPELEDWRRKGLNVDIRKALLLQTITEAKIQEARGRLSELIGDPLFNSGSSDQMADLLYERWKLPVQTKRRKRNETQTVTTDYEARKRLRWYIEQRKRLTPELIKAREFLLLVDYLEGEEKKLEYFARIAPDGRIHPYYKAHGAESLRLSSSPNVQNIPVHDISKWQSHGEDVPDPVVGSETGGKCGSIRSIIVPDNPLTDWILTCDFSQMQIFIMAKQFNIRWLLDIYEKGTYLYGAVYEKLFKEPFWPEGVAKTKANKLKSVDAARLRRAKAVPLGFLFLRTAAAVAEEYGWTLEEATVLRNWWFEQCPELEQGASNVKYRVQQDEKIRHRFGNIMWFPGGKITEAINSYAQSPEALIMIESLIMISRKLHDTELYAKGNRLILSVHDSLSINCRGEDGVVQVYEGIVQPILERPIRELDGFVFGHEAEVSKALDWETEDYGKWKEKHVPQDAGLGSDRSARTESKQILKHGGVPESGPQLFT